MSVSTLPTHRRSVQLLLLQFVFGSTIVLPNAPLRVSHGAAVDQAGRSGLVRCAYNPQPNKAKPKKAKVKGPKEKVPPSAAAAQQLVPEQTFFEGPPSITETFIPGLSLFTVVGVIPFSASLARQAWTRYKITNKRMEIQSGAPPPPPPTHRLHPVANTGEATLIRPPSPPARRVPGQGRRADHLSGDHRHQVAAPVRRRRGRSRAHAAGRSQGGSSQPTPQPTSQPTPQPTPAVAPPACSQRTPLPTDRHRHLHRHRYPHPHAHRHSALRAARASLLHWRVHLLWLGRPALAAEQRGSAPQVEIRSMPEFDRNLKFMFDQVCTCSALALHLLCTWLCTCSALALHLLCTCSVPAPPHAALALAPRSCAPTYRHASHGGIAHGCVADGRPPPAGLRLP